MADILGISGSMEQTPASDEFEPRRHLLKPVTAETFKGLAISDLRAYANGKLAEGVFTLINGTGDDMTIAAKTVFATGLALEPNQRYTVFALDIGGMLTLEVNASGKGIYFTAPVTINPSSYLVFYMVANDVA